MENNKEEVRRFFENYSDNPEADYRRWMQASAREPVVQAVKVDWENGDDAEPEVDSFVNQALDSMRGKISGMTQFPGVAEADAGKFREQCLAYFGSPAAKALVEKFIGDYIKLSEERDQGNIFQSVIEDMATDLKRVRGKNLDYHHALHLDALRKALAFGTAVVFMPKFTGIRVPKDMQFTYSTLLTPTRNRMLMGLLDWLMGMGAFAKFLKSDALPLWRDAYLMAFAEIGGPRASEADIAKPFAAKTINRLVELVDKAYGTMFADGAFASAMTEFWGGEE